ncbi:MAG: hypothetical protein IBJ04_07025 [Hydrogenophaga sp.]|uniref:hypothetical protein n=1 Tax=Hydrogenophaga sp. TaxID=1904254 RepID=UPI00257F94AB|nr:hypothetical protein [Hydrogenophaga sp.]MBL0944060.1 hypothetical protein [Hydrogenophaga sp.]
MNTPKIRSIAVALWIASALGTGVAQGTRSTPGEGNYPAPASGGAAAAPGSDNAPAARPWRSGPRYTPGWSMMSEQERAQHRAQMHAARSPEECERILREHRRLMEQRAAERGKPMGHPPRAACPVK